MLLKDEAATKATADSGAVHSFATVPDDLATITPGRGNFGLGDWIDSHAMEIKPPPLVGYQPCIRLHARPRIVAARVRAIRAGNAAEPRAGLL